MPFSISSCHCSKYCVENIFECRLWSISYPALMVAWFCMDKQVKWINISMNYVSLVSWSFYVDFILIRYSARRIIAFSFAIVTLYVVKLTFFMLALLRWILKSKELLKSSDYLSIVSSESSFLPSWYFRENDARGEPCRARMYLREICPSRIYIIFIKKHKMWICIVCIIEN